MMRGEDGLVIGQGSAKMGLEGPVRFLHQGVRMTDPRGALVSILRLKARQSYFGRKNGRRGPGWYRMMAPVLQDRGPRPTGHRGVMGGFYPGRSTKAGYA